MTCSSLSFSLYGLLTLPYYLKHSFQPQPQNNRVAAACRPSLVTAQPSILGGQAGDKTGAKHTKVVGPHSALASKPADQRLLT